MNLIQFHTMRTALQCNASPGAARDVAAVERTLRDLFLASNAFRAVEVENTDDPDRLVIALCTFDPSLSEADVGRRLEQMWSERVSYGFWEAHTVKVESGHVELEAASRPSVTGGYVTVHVVAQQARVPAQRVASR